MSIKNEYSAGGVVYKKIDDKLYIALILSQDEVWTFPKGHIEEAEKPEETAIREVGEEIGILDLKIENLLEKIDYFFSHEKRKIHKFVYYFLMQAPESAELSPQLEEVSDAKWVEATEVLDQMTYKEDIFVLKKVFSILKI